MDVTKLSDEDLRKLPDGDQAKINSDYWVAAKLEMEWRAGERQLEFARSLSKFTKQLVTATRILAIATVALFVASVVQVLVAVFAKS
jgi:hypothetical protein